MAETREKSLTPLEASQVLEQMSSAMLGFATGKMIPITQELPNTQINTKPDELSKYLDSLTNLIVTKPRYLPLFCRQVEGQENGGLFVDQVGERLKKFDWNSLPQQVKVEDRQGLLIAVGEGILKKNNQKGKVVEKLPQYDIADSIAHGYIVERLKDGETEEWREGLRFVKNLLESMTQIPNQDDKLNAMKAYFDIVMLEHESVLASGNFITAAIHLSPLLTEPKESEYKRIGFLLQQANYILEAVLDGAFPGQNTIDTLSKLRPIHVAFHVWRNMIAENLQGETVPPRLVKKHNRLIKQREHNKGKKSSSNTKQELTVATVRAHLTTGVKEMADLSMDHEKYMTQVKLLAGMSMFYTNEMEPYEFGLLEPPRIGQNAALVHNLLTGYQMLKSLHQLLPENYRRLCYDLIVAQTRGDAKKYLELKEQPIDVVFSFPGLSGMAFIKPGSPEITYPQYLNKVLDFISSHDMPALWTPQRRMRSAVGIGVATETSIPIPSEDMYLVILEPEFDFTNATARQTLITAHLPDALLKKETAFTTMSENARLQREIPREFGPSKFRLPRVGGDVYEFTDRKSPLWSKLIDKIIIKDTEQGVLRWEIQLQQDERFNLPDEDLMLSGVIDMKRPLSFKFSDDIEGKPGLYSIKNALLLCIQKSCVPTPYDQAHFELEEEIDPSVKKGLSEGGIKKTIEMPGKVRQIGRRWSGNVLIPGKYTKEADTRYRELTLHYRGIEISLEEYNSNNPLYDQDVQYYWTYFRPSRSENEKPIQVELPSKLKERSEE